MAFLTPTPSPVRSMRLTMNDGQNLNSLINPVEDLVFEDGNLIIISSDAYSTKTFKVYEGLMSQYSPVIRKKIDDAKRTFSGNTPAMGSGPTPTDLRAITLYSANASTLNQAQDPSDPFNHSPKCTTINIAEPPSAFEHFMRAIHNISYFKPPPAHASMEAIRTILFLADKYAVSELLQRALAHIYTLFPLTLQSWDNRRNKATSNQGEEFKSHLEDCLKLLAILCRVKDASWALPMTLYDICRFNISTIEGHRLWANAIPLRIRAKIRDGYTPQMELTKEVLSFILTSSPPECPSREGCLTARFEVAKSIVSWPLNDPLGVWSDGDWEMFNESVCGACMKRLREEYAEHREKAWSQIPRIFGFQVEMGQGDGDGWDELRHSFYSILGSVPLW